MSCHFYSRKLFICLWLTIGTLPLWGIESAYNSPQITLQDEAREPVFINHLMSRMTLKEKIGQLSQYVGRELLTGPRSGMLSDSLLAHGMVGSILNIGGVANIRKIQEHNMNMSRLKIPILFAFDVIHGYKTIFPTPLAESCSWDLELIRQTARAAAIEASAAGIQWTFAPMVDVARDPRWGRIVEGAGEDTYLGCKIAEARVKGFQWNLWQPDALLACAKHFAAYGAPQAGRDYAPVDMSASTLAEVYLPPFKACVDAGVQTFMSAFNDINGIPATGNRWLLTDLLRSQWGFKGIVVSDWNAVKQLTTQGVVEDEAGAAVKALLAGLDMDMTDGVYNAHLEQAVVEGRVPMTAIDTAVRRVLGIKYRLGLFDDPYRFCDAKREKTVTGSNEIKALARQAACRTVVLLKNDHQLPLSTGIRRIALVGPLADNRAEMLGSWKARGEEKEVVSVRQGLQEALGDVTISYAQGCDIDGHCTDGFAEAMQTARESELTIAVVGEKALMSGESRSRAHLGLPGVQELLIDSLKATGRPLVVLLMNGRPLTLEHVSRQADALVECWFLGTQAGHAVADVLTGRYNPSGKLTTSFPCTEGQIPNYYNYKRSGRPGDMEYASTVRHIDQHNANLYPFGYGLSYTHFSYGNLRCPDRFDADGKARIVVGVTNDGDCDGEEVVQLYVADDVASMVRPVKELKGFRKVMVPRGKTVDVEFILDAHNLGFWTNDMRYVVESGVFTVMVGPDSEHLDSHKIRYN